MAVVANGDEDGVEILSEKKKKRRGFAEEKRGSQQVKGGLNQASMWGGSRVFKLVCDGHVGRCFIGPEV